MAFEQERLVTLGGQLKGDTAFQTFGYLALTDNKATIIAAGYFNNVKTSLRKRDIIKISDQTTSPNTTYEVEITGLPLGGDVVVTAYPDASSPAAGSVTTDTTNFDNILSVADTNVQKALDTIDDMTGAEIDIEGEDVSLDTTNFDHILSVADDTVQKALDTIDDNAVTITGEIKMWPNATAPTGYILCNGASLLRAGTYADLFAVTGTSFGSVDATHFNVPDFQGVFPRGAGSQTINARTKGGGSLGDTNEDQSQGHYHNLDIRKLNNDFVGAVTSHMDDYAGASTGTIKSDRVKALITDGSNGAPRIGTTTEPSSVDINYIIKT